MAENTQKSDNSVTWGGVVAGAAVAAGAVLVFPSVVPSLAGGLESIGEAIVSTVTGIAGEAAVPTISAETARTIAGATLLGGGLAYLGMGGSSKKSADDLFDEAVTTQDQAGFAAREDMKRMQALMMARMQVANPQHMAELAAAQPQR